MRLDLARFPEAANTTAESKLNILGEFNLLQARRLGVAAVVKKPWKPQELVELVQSVRDRWHP